MKTLLLFLFLMFPFVTFASMEDWTEEQKKWYIASNVVILADWATTRDLSRRYHEGFHETNPFMGRYPSTKRVDHHFLTVLVAHYFVTDILSSKNRTIYLQFFTIGQASIVANNLNLGLRIRF